MVSAQNQYSYDGPNPAARDTLLDERVDAVVLVTLEISGCDSRKAESPADVATIVD